MVSVAHLEPTTDPATDPYKRRLPQSLLPEVTDKDKERIKRLLRKRIRRIRHFKGKLTEYLVRWVGHGPEHDV